MQFLRQSTAVPLMFGPFLDDTDGKTYKTELTIASSAIRLSKNGGAFATTSSSISLTHNEYGWYSGTFNATDTDTVGQLVIHVSGAGALPVWREFTVLPAGIYDSFISGTASITVYPTGVFATTSSGLTADALSQIVSSGNANGWADGATAAEVWAYGTKALTAAVTTSGLTPEALTQIVASGDAAGWNATTTITEVTVSGFTPNALSEIVASGNAANWSGVTPATDLTTVNDKLDVISGYTDTLEAIIGNLPTIDIIIASGNAANWSGVADLTLVNTKLDTISGYTDTLEAGLTTINANVLALPDITEIVDSGNAEGWNSYNVTVTGLAPDALSEIVASGDAAGWSATAVLTGIANDVWTYTDRRLTDAGIVVTGIFNETLAGTLDFRTAQIEQWAYAANDVNISGTVSGVAHEYFDPTDSAIFRLEATPSGRIRTDL